MAAGLALRSVGGVVCRYAKRIAGWMFMSGWVALKLRAAENEPDLLLKRDDVTEN